MATDAHYSTVHKHKHTNVLLTLLIYTGQRHQIT